MQKTKIAEDISLFETEENLLNELRDYELENDREMNYTVETRLTGNSETLEDMNLEEVDIERLAGYMEDVRTQRGNLVDSREGVRNPVSYNLEEHEEGLVADIVYEHPRGFVISEITGEVPQSNDYEVDQVLQDD